MKKYMITLLVPAAVLLASCDRKAEEVAGAAGTPVAAEQVADDKNAQEPTQPSKLVGFGIGNFVEADTYAVGGQGLSFKATDNLYAVVDYAGLPANTSVSVKVKRAGGEEVSQVTRTTESDTQTSITFDLDIPKKTQLAAGIYTFEASVAGLPALTQNVEIQ